MLVLIVQQAQPTLYELTMPADPDSLYGIARPRRKPEQEISSTSSAAFTSQLGSLLSKSRDNKLTGSGRSRSTLDSKSRKDDIFTAHRNKKRAAKDISKDENGQNHQTQETIGGVEEAMLKKSKRKMEEKARLYAAMKRGDYVETRRGYVNDEDRGPLVDFDRKWAEDGEGGDDTGGDTSSEDDDSENDEELVEYQDEFGRTRKGTRAELAREERRRRILANAEEELADMSARPKMPTNIIRGDAIQAEAFNPDAALERQMEELAARRDRSQTPPEDTHYDATKEIRSKGVGFYQFSKDNELRKQEMENLGETRKQTETWEEERRQNREKKEADFDESKRREKERQSEREANAFLKSIGESGLSAFVSGSNDDAPKKKKKGWGK